MVCNLSEGRIYKGSNAEVTVPVLPRCFTGETNDMVVNFYTVSGTSVQFSQTAGTLTVTGTQGTVVFQPVQLEVLEDGQLKYNVTYTDDGSAYTRDLETRLFIKTPENYTPIDYISSDNVETILDRRLTAYTQTTEFATINGSGITSGDSLVIFVPTKTSQLTNDSGFLTEHQDISGKQDVLVSGTNIKTVNSQSILGSGDLVISIPTKTSELTNDSGFLTEHQDISGKQDVLVSGTNIKTVNGQTLLGSGNITIEYSAGTNIDISNNVISVTGITVPTKTSQLTNDSGFLTEHQDISGKQDVLVSGTNIKTVNNQSLLGSGNLTISAGTTYSAGTNININNGVISVTGITSYTGITSSDVTTALGYTPVSSSTLTSIWTGTQVEYDAIVTKSSTTLYLIK